MVKFGFAAARPGEQIVHGSQRPGYPAKSVSKAKVDDWIAARRTTRAERELYEEG